MTPTLSLPRRLRDGARTLTAPAVAVPVIALLVFSLTWTGRLYDPDHGLDASWQNALYAADHLHLHFGSQFVFTYGPLGFLMFPILMYPGALALVAYAWVALMLAATVALLAWSAQRSLRNVLLTAVVTFVGATVLEDPRIWQLGYEAPVTVLVVVWCAHALDLESDHLLVRGLPVLGAALAGVELLGKLSVGVLVLSLVLFTLLARGQRRGVAVFVAALVATILLGWIAVGQPLSAFGAYATTSLDVVDGYSTAMAGGVPDVPFYAAAIASALLVAGAVSAEARYGGRRAGALAVLLLLFLFQTFKAAFVAGGGHVDVFFISAVGAWFAIPWRELHRVVAIGALAALVALFGWGTASSARDMLDYGPPLSQRWSVLHAYVAQALEPRNRAALLVDSRQSLQQQYAVPPRIIAAVRGHSVHVDPWEMTIAWAYSLDWHPVPVFQAYAAYTPKLDRLDAEAYASPTGPEVVLRENVQPPLDRIRAFESPAAVVSMLCHYADEIHVGDWEVVRRVPDRCGRPRLIQSVQTTFGQPFRVPRSGDDLVVAKVSGLAPSFTQRIVSALYRGSIDTITIDLRSGRLVPGTAPDGLLMYAPPRADFPRPFEFSPDAHVVRIDSEASSSGRLTIRFFAIPIRAAR